MDTYNTKFKISGTAEKKTSQKTYYRHSTYPGGLKATSLAELLETHPTRVIEFAVKGMLPHTNLGRAMYRKLRVYPGASHPHQAQLTPAEAKAEQTAENTEATK